jgi:hypothetical protein
MTPHPSTITANTANTAMVEENSVCHPTELRHD